MSKYWPRDGTSSRSGRSISCHIRGISCSLVNVCLNFLLPCLTMEISQMLLWALVTITSYFFLDTESLGYLPYENASVLSYTGKTNDQLLYEDRMSRSEDPSSTKCFALYSQKVSGSPRYSRHSFHFRHAAAERSTCQNTFRSYHSQDHRRGHDSSARRSRSSPKRTV